ncbi:MAG: hypothetical protein ACI9S8_000585 [Chlamydiales bacterium]|jgi:hypothetical protein
MRQIPRMTEDDIRSLLGEGTFSRGEEYLKGIIIRETCYERSAIYGQCANNSDLTYDVKISFHQNQFQGSSCSCFPLENQPCVHVTALLIYWVNNPEKFETLEKIESLLEMVSKEDLLNILSSMLTYHPSLRRLARSLIVTGKVTKTAADESYTHEVSEIFQRVGSAWDVETQLHKDLRTIKVLGDDLIQKGDYGGALSIYDALCMGILNNYLNLFDEGGELLKIVRDCISNLSELLEVEQSNASLRGTVLGNLFRIYRTDMRYGCIGFGEQIPDAMVKLANSDEKNKIVLWIEEQLNSRTNAEDDYQVEGYRQFLSSLN